MDGIWSRHGPIVVTSPFVVPFLWVGTHRKVVFHGKISGKVRTGSDHTSRVGLHTLVMTNIANWKINMFNGKTHYK